MSTFDEREKGFERKYVLDEELAFKANARRNKLVGLWAAGKLGKTGPDAEAYAAEVVAADFEKPGEDDVLAKLVADFKNADIAISEADIRTEMERQLAVARQQVASSANA